MKSFQQYNESIRDHMTPVDPDVIIKRLGNLSGYELKNYITDLIFKNDKDLLNLILKNVDFTRLSEYELFDLVELAIEMNNINTVNLLLNNKLHYRFLEKLYLYALECGYTQIANSIKELIVVKESIRDHMTPKSEADVKKAIKELDPSRKLLIGIENDLLWAVKEATQEGQPHIRHYDLEIEPSEDVYLPPVVYAIEMGRTEIAKYLIDSGYHINKDENKAIKTAVRMKNMEIIDKLIEKDEDLINIAFLSSVTRLNTDYVKMFLNRGADVHFKNETALTNALGRQSDEIVQMLLDKGANLKNAVDKCTPIGKKYAEKFRQKGLFHKLFRNKTNESIRDHMTPKSEAEIFKNMPNFIELYNELKSWYKRNKDVIISEIAFDTNHETYAYFTIYITNIDNHPGFGEYGKTALMVKCFNDNELYLSVKKRYNFTWETISFRTDFSEVVRELSKLRSTNESVRDHMTPVSDEEIMKKLDGLTNEQLVDYLLDQMGYTTVDEYMSNLIFSRIDLSKLDQQYKDTIIAWCVWGNNTTMLKAILDSGVADDTIKNLYKHCDKFGRVEIKNFLDTYYAYNKTNESVRDHMTPISKADLIEKLPIVKILKANGIKILDIISKKQEIIIKLERDVLIYVSVDATPSYTAKIKGEIIYLGIKPMKCFDYIMWYFEDEGHTNESVRSHMTPKSEEEIIKGIGELKGYTLAQAIIDNIYGYDDRAIELLLTYGNFKTLSDHDIKDILSPAIHFSKENIVKYFLDRGVSDYLLDVIVRICYQVKNSNSKYVKKYIGSNIGNMVDAYRRKKVNESVGNTSVGNTSVRTHMVGKVDKLGEYKVTVKYLIEQMKESFNVSVTYYDDADAWIIFIEEWVEESVLREWFKENTTYKLKSSTQLKNKITMVEVYKNKLDEGVRDTNGVGLLRSTSETGSLRDKMTPVSEEMLIKKLKRLSDIKLRNFILNSLWTGDEKMLALLVLNVDVSVVSDFDKVDIIKSAIGKDNIAVVTWILGSGLSRHLLEHLYEYVSERRMKKYVELIKKYIKQLPKGYTNKVEIFESVRDMMTGKSKVEVGQALDNMLEGDYNTILIKNINALMSIFNVVYEDEVYYQILKEMDFNLLHIHMGSIMASVANTGLSKIVIKRFQPRVRHIKTHEGIYNMSHDIGDEIGDVYYRDEILRRLIKLNPLVVTKTKIKRLVLYGTSMNESVRDKMTPKSKLELKVSYDKLLNSHKEIKKRFILMEIISKKQFNFRNGNVIRSIDVMDLGDEDLNDLIKRYYIDVMNESVRDKMLPKSKEEIHNLLSLRYYIKPYILKYLVDAGYKFKMAHRKHAFSTGKLLYEFYNKEKDKSIYFQRDDTLEYIKLKMK